MLVSVWTKGGRGPQWGGQMEGVGHKLGELSFTRLYRGHLKTDKKSKR